MEIQNLVGLFMPPVIDLINKRIADDRVRFIISAILCVVVGLVINLDKLSNPSEILGSIAIVFATAQTTYNLYWKKSKIRKSLK